MAQKRGKRDSDEVDKLMAKVDALKEKGMSVNKACQQVGLQTTVYYFRKRKEDALNNASGPVYSGGGSMMARRGHNGSANIPFENASVKELTDEYQKTVERLRELEQRISSTVVAQLRGESPAQK